MAQLSPQKILQAFLFPIGVPKQLRPGLTILWVAMAMAVLAHARWMPLWAILLNTVAFALHAVTMMHWPRQRQRFDNWVAIILMLLLTQLHQDFPDRETGVAIFPILFVFKVRQLYTLRDYHVCCMMACVQTGLLFLYQQSILMLLYVSCICLLLACSMAWPYLPQSIKSTRRRLRYIGGLCCQSLPFMLLLFLLFPRIPGPLWSLPKSDSSLAKSGISNELRIGDITRLVPSDKVIFRATFAGQNPQNKQLYWRGPVLGRTNGIIWSQWDGGRNRRISATSTAKPVSYTITIEPYHGNWLFALGLPHQVPPGTRKTSDLQLLAKEQITIRSLYQLQSYLQYSYKEINLYALHYSTQLPPYGNQQTRDLAQQWRDRGLTAQQIVDQALNMFNQDFSYTLTPPAMSGDVIDQFIFNHKQGFCSHFATAFATLMRAAQIPARVVTGFQGGEYNDVGNFFVIRERDAHAWTEVWLPELGGWIQIDPTAAVAPQRIESGMTEFLTSGIGQEIGAAAGIGDVLPSAIHKRLLLWLDAVQHKWNQNVLQYNRGKQQQLLEHAGMVSLADRPWLLLSIMLLLLVAVSALYLTRRSRLIIDPVKLTYDSFCTKLERAGLPWHNWQAPLQRQQLASRNWPANASEINKITNLYLRLRYGHSNRSSLRQLQQLVRKFNIN